MKVRFCAAVVLLFCFFAAGGCTVKQRSKSKSGEIQQREVQESNPLRDRFAYVAAIRGAFGKIEQGDYEAARNFLMRCPKSERGWAWRFLHSLADTRVSTISTDIDYIESVTFSDNSELVAVSDHEGRIQVYDILTAELVTEIDIRELVPGIAYSRVVAFNADLTKAVVEYVTKSDYDTCMKKRLDLENDWQQGESDSKGTVSHPQLHYMTTQRTMYISFSESGMSLFGSNWPSHLSVVNFISRDSSEVKFDGPWVDDIDWLDVDASGDFIFHEPAPGDIVFDAAGRPLALRLVKPFSGSEGGATAVEKWDLTDGSREIIFESMNPIRSARFSRRGEQVAVISQNIDFDIPKITIIPIMEPGRTLPLDLPPQSHLIALSFGGDLKEIKALVGRRPPSQVRTIHPIPPEETGAVSDTQSSEDSVITVGGGPDDPEEELYLHESPPFDYGLRYKSDHGVLSWDTEIWIWNAETGSLIVRTGVGTHDDSDLILLSANGDTAYCDVKALGGPGFIDLRDISSIRHGRSYAFKPTNPMNVSEFSPDGHLIAGLGKPGVQLWHSLNLRPVEHILGDSEYGGWPTEPSVIDVAPDVGRIVCELGGDGILIFYDLITGSFQHRKAHSGKVLSVAIDQQSGAIAASAAADGTVKLWDCRTGLLKRVLAQEKTGDRGEVFLHVEISPDGKTVAASTLYDKAIRRWRVEDGLELEPLRVDASRETGTGEPVPIFTFTPDGDEIVGVTCTGRFCRWNARNGSVVKDFRPMVDIASTPRPEWNVGEGKYLAHAAFSKDACIFAIQRGEEVVLIDPADGDVVQVIETPYTPSDIAFSCDNREIALVGDWGEPLFIYDVVTGEELLAVDTNMIGLDSMSLSTGPIVFTADERRLVCGSAVGIAVIDSAPQRERFLEWREGQIAKIN
ncbi:MAG: WD40 repeat domain-containing protein [Deltaproteobacteria bacterium]|nr:WD40 repeat domain-containing protein [Deltaproteobacteria bacterium]